MKIRREVRRVRCGTGCLQADTLDGQAAKHSSMTFQVAQSLQHLKKALKDLSPHAKQARSQIGCTDARVGQGQVHCRSSARLSIGAEKVAEFDKHIYLAMKRLTVAREIVDTSKTQVKHGTDSPTVSTGGMCRARPPSQLQELVADS